MTDSLFDEEPAYVPGKVNRAKNGRPYILANPNDELRGTEWLKEQGFTDRPQEPRGPSKSYSRTTTFISCLEDTYNLGQHLERGVAVGMARKASLVARTNNINLDGPEAEVKRALTQICEEAKDAANWNEKAALGTAFHDLAQAYDEKSLSKGSYERLTPEFDVMLAAYSNETADFAYAHIEQGVVNDDLGYYGTPDRLTWIWCEQCAETRRTARGRLATFADGPNALSVDDIKTGRIDYGQPKMALQMAAYAIGKLYDPDTGIRTELPICQHYARIIHVPYGEGTCTIYPIYLPPAIEALVALVPAVRAFRSRSTWFEAPTAGSELKAGLAASWPDKAPEAL